MSTDSTLAGTATLFLALGDKTRLRLLNLMRDREVCVSSFTEVLGQSQPKISRHLAYLRNAGVVEVRRDGKWMHYSISAHLDGNSRRLLFELFKWMEAQDALDRDRKRYESKNPDQAPPARIRQEREPRSIRKAETRTPTRLVEVETRAPEPVEDRVIHHNELEDFLL